MERPGPNGPIPSHPEACVAVPRFYTSPAAGGGSGVSDAGAIGEQRRRGDGAHAKCLHTPCERSDMLNRGLTLRSIRDMWAGGGKRGKPRGPENETSIDEIIAAAFKSKFTGGSIVRRSANSKRGCEGIASLRRMKETLSRFYPRI